MACEAKEWAECKAKELEAWEKLKWDAAARIRRVEEEWVRQEVVAWRVAKAKFLQHQVWMSEASESRPVMEKEVSPSPTPSYMKLIWKQIAQVSFQVLGYSVGLTAQNRQVAG